MRVFAGAVRLFVASLLIVLIPMQQTGFAAGQPQSQNAAGGAQDPGWPRQVVKDGATLVYYQPQVDEWKDYKELSARVAFSLTPSGGKQVLGVASMQAGTIVDKASRTAYIRDVKVTSVRFPSLEPQAAASMENLFKELVPKGGEPISVDRLMADLQHTKTESKPIAAKTDPPQIFYSAKPAILLMVEDKPVLAPIEKTDLQFVVNANWNVVFDKSSKTYYLAYENGWLSAQDLVKGPWTPTQKLPKDMSKLPADQTWAAVKKLIPPPPPSGVVPQVFFSSGPAELIVFKSAPVYTKIPGTQLLYAANTDNDVFLNSATKQFYVLLSGRWFHSAALGGPWSYAADLPADFAKIPPNSPKGRVLASVPGTIEASDAVMLAQIPTSAVINKAEAEAKVKVAYDGAPQFKPIESTSLQYAANTQDKVIKVGDLYYLCFQGVWFMSKDANGPWKTADSVPQEIYTIPPSSPVYNVTYVTQTNPTATTVECSQTDGYLGMFVIGMTVGAVLAYGTGYYYPPYVYWGGAVPIYRPWPGTYGVGAVYNPWTGGYKVGRASYGPYGGVGSSAWYNPATGRYGRGATAQGWYGGRSVGRTYNPWTGTAAATRQGHSPYAQWGSSAAVRGNQWAQSGHVTTAGGTVSGYRSSAGAGVGYRGANGAVARTTNGVYAGNDGNVYRKNSNGGWSQYNNGSWNQVSQQQQQQAQEKARQQAQQDVQTRQQNVQTRQQNVETAQQNVQTARQQGQQLPQSDQQALQNARQQRAASGQNISPSTMQGLNNSAQARQRGQLQTQRFQGFQGLGGRGGFRRR
ncbi:MAG TPA: hypothetical protein VKZ53_01205 [Candidatus Angelobacter sp.]|nr:hypothetical protein [Candidatus Angelobacter sp.]